MTDRPSYRLPDGGITHKHVEYVQAWRTMGGTLGHLFNGTLYAFDPGFTLYVGHRSIDIEMVVAEVIMRLLGDLRSLLDVIELNADDELEPETEALITRLSDFLAQTITPEP